MHWTLMKLTKASPGRFSLGHRSLAWIRSAGACFFASMALSSVAPSFWTIHSGSALADERPQPNTEKVEKAEQTEKAEPGSKKLIANPTLKDASEVEPKVFENVTVIEKLGTQVDLSMKFRNETDTEVQLSDYLTSGAPLILTLNYFSCGTLCSLQLGGFARSISQMSDKQRQDLRILTISFDPKDTPKLAQERKDHFLGMIESPVKPKWDFLVADEGTVQKITQSLGFQYRFDPETNQFAHTAAIFFLSPLGIISRYLYGIEFSIRDIRFAWIEASEGRFGTNLERLILRCFHYDATTGKYTPFAYSVVRWSGLLTVLALGLGLWTLWRREKRGMAGGLNSAV